MKDFLEVMQEGERIEPSTKDLSRGIPNFSQKLAGLISIVANESGMASHKRKYLIEEAATTSDFPILFATILERQLLAQYEIAAPDWKTYIKTGTQNDFRPQEGIGVYGLQGPLAQVIQRGEYKSDAAIGMGKVLISLNKFGRRFGLAWETLINDDLGAFSDLAMRLSNAALRTEYRQATQLFCTAAGPNTGLYGAPINHPIDGKPVTNLYNLPFTIDNLGTVCAAMRRQTDADGEPIMIEGFELVVPPALEITMYTVLHSALVLLAGGDSTSGAKSQIRGNVNVIPELNITGHVNPYLPLIDASGKQNATWYLFAKLSSGACAKLNFLKGHEAPDLVMKNPNKVTLGGGSVNPLDGDFESDSVEWRIRHIMGGAAWESRMTAASTGS